MNAANGIANTASAALLSFTNNIVMAFRPRIIKHYAQGDYLGMQRLLELSIQVIILLMCFLIVPLFFCMGEVLEIWLVDVPENSLMFCRLLLLWTYVEIINTVIKIGIHSSGKMKDFTLASFILNTFSLILTYIAYKSSMSVFTTYYIAILISCVNVSINIYFLKKCVPSLNVWKITLKILVTNLACVAGFIMAYLWNEATSFFGVLNFILLTSLNGTFLAVFTVFLFYDRIKKHLKRGQ